MDFIERIFRVAPDNGTGTLEFLIMAALLILLFAVFARWLEVRKNNHLSLSKAIATPRASSNVDSISSASHEIAGNRVFEERRRD